MASRCIVRQAKVSTRPADKLSASLRVKTGLMRSRRFELASDLLRASSVWWHGGRRRRRDWRPKMRENRLFLCGLGYRKWRAWSWRCRNVAVPSGFLPFQRMDRAIKPWDQTAGPTPPLRAKAIAAPTREPFHPKVAETRFMITIFVVHLRPFETNSWDSDVHTIPFPYCGISAPVWSGYPFTGLLPAVLLFIDAWLQFWYRED